MNQGASDEEALESVKYHRRMSEMVVFSGIMILESSVFACGKNSGHDLMDELGRGISRMDGTGLLRRS